MVSLVATGAALATAAAMLWPFSASSAHLWLAPILFALITLTGRFPIKLSRQAEASLLIIPLFMASLLLHPTIATLIAAAGTAVSEALLKAPARAIAFNTAVNALAAAFAGIVLFSLKPEGTALALSASQMLPAGAAGLTLYAANFVLVSIMVTIRKGLAFWGSWRQAFAFEALQEGGFLSIGLIGALLVSLAWWGPIVVIIPAVLAYYAFGHTVSEAANKARLAEELERSLKELKELQAHLIQSAKMASVGALATGIAHEINNPVFAISGRADLLIKGKDKHLSSEKALEYVETISQMAARISAVTRHLTEYAQPAGEQKELKLADAMEAAVTLMGKKLKGVRLIREYGQDVWVKGVRAQLEQVFVNLLANAVEATPEWGSISLGCVVEADMAVGYVRDTGVGMSEEVKGRLFEPFVSVKEVDKRVGMGLGLYTCERIISGHGGQIGVDSQLGMGTTVWVKLPLVGVEVAKPEVVAVGQE
jgi:signal transduction histidine kinase